MSKIEITASVVLKIGDTRVSLTVEEAKALQKELNSILSVEKETEHGPVRIPTLPYIPWGQPYDPYPISPWVTPDQPYITYTYSYNGDASGESNITSWE